MTEAIFVILFLLLLAVGFCAYTLYQQSQLLDKMYTELAAAILLVVSHAKDEDQPEGAEPTVEPPVLTHTGKFTGPQQWK